MRRVRDPGRRWRCPGSHVPARPAGVPGQASGGGRTGSDGNPVADRRSHAPYVLREYALLADGYRGALVDPGGEICWLCFPRWESPSVFGSLLGAAGRYVVTPSDPCHAWGGYYEPGSLIWNSRWVTPAGAIESRAALAFPGDRDRLVLLRRIRALDHDAEVSIRLETAADFGRAGLRDLRRADDTWLGRSGDLYVRCSGEVPLLPTAESPLAAVVPIRAGGQRDLVLEISVEAFREPAPDAHTAWRATEQAWRQQSGELRAGLAGRDAGFAHAVLVGMTEPGGGTVAAVTTSLPERAHAGRNYDYRYAWIRDQCYIGQAAAAAGADALLDSSAAFVRARLLADGPSMAPAYTTGGHPVPGQQPLTHLTGYPGGEVRTGNHVREQFQLDAYGEALLLLAAASVRGRLDPPAWRAVEVAVEAIQRRWTEPDSGVWELSPRQWTHSKLTCVAGLRAVSRVAPARQAGHWAGLADRILAEVGRCALHPSGRWQRGYDDPRIDAALLLPAIRGALHVEDPRSVATRQAVLGELAEDGYLYRFRPDERPLGDAEGAFLLCGFLAALATQQAGQPVLARAWFERNRAGCGPPGLYTEEYDVRQRQLRGNLPQAFVHALLLETAVTLGSG
ncbi:glycoside hydrolase family 15 protein [Plantactinospora sp. WMMB782]|uniref:glycoside hydrolase family 15 protein n=1 Tax=Plantactinospora sp. WMMB782 TaxID=3404121 RepID=UPI003B953F73